MAGAVVITIEDLLIGKDGVPLEGTCKPEPNCPHCKGRGFVKDHRVSSQGERWQAVWTCICSKPERQVLKDYWEKRIKDKERKSNFTIWGNGYSRMKYNGRTFVRDDSSYQE